MLRSWPVLLVVLATTACGLPKDPEGTSERLAATHELRVGVTDNGQWVDAHSAEPAGIEPALVRQFATKIGAHVLWSRGSETSLAQSLKHGDIDVAIGGFEPKTPWKSIVGVSQPFAETQDKKKHVFLAAPGENRFILALDSFLTEHMRVSKGAQA